MDQIGSVSRVIDASLGSGSAVRAQVAFAVAAKMLDVQQAAGAAVVALLDPNVGAAVDRKA